MSHNLTDIVNKSVRAKRATSDLKALYEEIGDRALNIDAFEVIVEAILSDKAAAIAAGLVRELNLIPLTEDITVAGQQSFFTSIATTLTNAILDGVSTANIVLGDTSYLPDNGFVLIESEVIGYATKNVDGVTLEGISRGQKGTSGAAHVASEVVDWDNEFGDNRVRGWTSDKYGSEYGIQLFDKDDNEIFPQDVLEWDFNTETGILNLNNSPGAILPFKVSGTVIEARRLNSTIKFVNGTSPEGLIEAPPGAICINKNPEANGGVGAVFYVKESGTGSTGWAEVSPAPFPNEWTVAGVGGNFDDLQTAIDSPDVVSFAEPRTKLVLHEGYKPTGSFNLATGVKNLIYTAADPAGLNLIDTSQDDITLTLNTGIVIWTGLHFEGSFATSNEYFVAINAAVTSSFMMKDCRGRYRVRFFNGEVLKLFNCQLEPNPSASSVFTLHRVENAVLTVIERCQLHIKDANSRSSLLDRPTAVALKVLNIEIRDLDLIVDDLGSFQGIFSDNIKNNPGEFSEINITVQNMSINAESVDVETMQDWFAPAELSSFLSGFQGTVQTKNQRFLIVDGQLIEEGSEVSLEKEIILPGSGSIDLLNEQDIITAKRDAVFIGDYLFISTDGNGVYAYNSNRATGAITQLDNVTENDATFVFTDSVNIFTISFNRLKAYSFDGNSLTLEDSVVGAWGSSDDTYGNHTYDGQYIYINHDGTLRPYEFLGGSLTALTTQAGFVSGVVGSNSTYIFAHTGVNLVTYTFDGVAWASAGNPTATTQPKQILADDGDFVYLFLDTGGIEVYSFDGVNFSQEDTIAYPANRSWNKAEIVNEIIYVKLSNNNDSSTDVIIYSFDGNTISQDQIYNIATGQGSSGAFAANISLLIFSGRSGGPNQDSTMLFYNHPGGSVPVFDELFSEVDSIDFDYFAFKTGQSQKGFLQAASDNINSDTQDTLIALGGGAEILFTTGISNDRFILNLQNSNPIGGIDVTVRLKEIVKRKFL